MEIQRIVKVLGIAPYESMKTSMQNLAQNRSDLSLDVYVGDLDEGARIVRQNLPSQYDVIISRGGTAQKIAEITSTPVVEISLSVYDVLRAIKLGENYSDKYAIVGFPSITQSARLLCDLLQYKVDIFPIHHEEEAYSVVRRLKSEGYRMLLCDMIASTAAKSLGLNAILITSGAESIENALDQAVKVGEGFYRIQEERDFFAELLKTGSSLAVFNAKKEVIFTFWETPGQFPEGEILSLLEGEVDETFACTKRKCTKIINRTYYRIQACALSGRYTGLCVFRILPEAMPSAPGKSGISFLSRKEAEDSFFNSFFSITNASDETISAMAQGSSPIMVTGEYGTGKSKAAQALYARSGLSCNPLVTIDGELAGEKTWDFLLNHHDSPLRNRDLTLFLRNLDRLSEDRCRQLLTWIQDTKLQKRCRIIASCTLSGNSSIPPSCLRFMDTLKCLTLKLPPLRQISSDIPALTSLFLGTLNPDLPQPIIGLEADAMKFMQNYSWPGNFPQFKRVLKQLASLSSSPYICLKDVKALLSQDESQEPHPARNGGFSIDLSGNLEEITKEIILQVLKETNSNQSAAAKRLGISRTTLWRYLNR